jgi:hypothetical protein
MSTSITQLSKVLAAFIIRTYAGERHELLQNVGNHIPADMESHPDRLIEYYD